MATIEGEAGGGRISLDDLRGSGRRRRKERRVRLIFVAAAATSVVINALIVLSLFGGAIDFLTSVDLRSLWSDGWFPRSGEFDIKTIVVGTLLVAVIAMLVAAPLGLGAALYLSEHATGRARRILKPILEVLAGIPSVVVAYFAIAWISPNIMQRFFDASFYSIGAAGIGVGLLTVPIVASVAEDALHAVPSSIREAAYGIGARKRSVSARIVFPAAVSGIVAALILGFSRAIGETLVVAIAAGGTGGSLFTLDPTGVGQTMTGAIASLAAGTDQPKGVSEAYPSLFFVGTLLFFMTLLLNVASERFVRRVRRRY